MEVLHLFSGVETGGNKNKIVHPETCERIGKALTCKKHTEEQKINNSNAQKGKKLSEEATYSTCTTIIFLIE